MVTNDITFTENFSMFHFLFSSLFHPFEIISRFSFFLIYSFCYVPRYTFLNRVSKLSTILIGTLSFFPVCISWINFMEKFPKRKHGDRCNHANVS